MSKSNEATKESASIVIVGSGVSGFTTAVRLIENGFSNVTILEAENRIGGRVFTTEFSEGLIDLGAQWCHGVEGNAVHRLAGDEYFSETEMDFSRMNFCRSDGTSTDGKTCEILMQLCNKILEELKEQTDGIIGELLTQKFCESLKEDAFKEIDKKLAKEVLENFKKRESSYCGCDKLEKITIDGFNKFKDCNGPTWLNWRGKGYKTIFDKILVKIYA